jgi:hypothetical protein
MTRGRSYPYSAPRLRKPRLLYLLVTIALIVVASTRSTAQDSSADEYEIRAAILLNLTKFIDWPASKLDAHSQFVICILGSDPIGPDADLYLHGQTVAGRPVEVLHLTTVDAADTCDMLYVSVTERKNVDHVLPELMKSGVLTISERSNATSPNQVIGLPTLEDHVGIDVNLTVAQRTGLTISSKLLRLATVSR